MSSSEQRPKWSGGLPDRGPGGPVESADGMPGPMYAFYMPTIRVEIDPVDQTVTEVLVDEGTMERPTLIVRDDGQPIADAFRSQAGEILSRAEWPTWDYGFARYGPTAR